jgi:hypothetical protein
MQSKLYHCGIRGRASRNTLAKANELRDWRIYADFAQVLVAKARTLYANDDFGVRLGRDVYALDSTTIDLCLTLFPWAKFRRHKAAVKMHTLMDLRGSILCFICITDGSTHDVNILDELVLESGALYIMDRGYLDFARLFTFTQNLCSFITRAKSNFRYTRIAYRQVDKSTGLRSDQTIRLAISVYLLAAIVKKELAIEQSLGEILQILSISLFEQMPIEQALTNNMTQNDFNQFHNQLSLFDL